MEYYDAIQITLTDPKKLLDSNKIEINEYIIFGSPLYISVIGCPNSLLSSPGYIRREWYSIPNPMNSMSRFDTFLIEIVISEIFYCWLLLGVLSQNNWHRSENGVAYILSGEHYIRV